MRRLFLFLTDDMLVPSLQVVGYDRAGEALDGATHLMVALAVVASSA